MGCGSLRGASSGRGWDARGLAEKPPRRLCFPKHFDVMQLVIFAGLCGLAWRWKYATVINYLNNFIWMVCFFVVAVYGLVCDSPFMEQYARDEMPEQVALFAPISFVFCEFC